MTKCRNAITGYSILLLFYKALLEESLQAINPLKLQVSRGETRFMMFFPSKYMKIIFLGQCICFTLNEFAASKVFNIRFQLQTFFISWNYQHNWQISWMKTLSTCSFQVAIVQNLLNTRFYIFHQVITYLQLVHLQIYMNCLPVTNYRWCVAAAIPKWIWSWTFIQRF